MFLTIDIGGTKTRIGHSTNLPELTKFQVFSTPIKLSELRELINKNLTEDTQAICIGIAATIDFSNKKILKSPQISGLSGLQFNQILPSDIPTYIRNDAELASLGEAHYQNRSKKYSSIAYITISTGLGGALVNNGELDYGHRFNREPGHIVINSHNAFSSNPYSGTFGYACSGTGFIKQYGVKPQECENSRIWDKYANDLACGLLSVTITWGVDLIILGGGMMKQYPRFMPKTKSIIKSKAFLLNYPATTIVSSKLEDKNGLIGGLLFLEDTLS